ncbi:E3 ubiquitin-protein ligase COP1 [Quillaja saponaria]|uniref:E3 ubiquitin-protein ligase COP1 n=1 Tax=Quillaja saponaria TaxID=32244 RepID=A0AAD7LUW8_QUISA|nr:E3 ubiquitin-protein ligase COP1 [Quillaja saponaria]
MDEVSVGPLVPVVKSDDPNPSSTATAHHDPCGAAISKDTSPSMVVAAAAETGFSEPDKDFLCPICMQIIKDAFLTSCGHSFCYMCITTHLRNKNDCPCCGHYLTNKQLFPNFLLDKVRLNFLGCEVSIKELDTLLTLLVEKKRKMEQEAAVRNMKILLDFLHCLRKQKSEELKEVQIDLQFIKEDLNTVERHRMELYHAKDRYSLYHAEDRYSMKLQMLNDSSGRKAWPSAMDKNSSGSSSLNMRGGFSSGSIPNKLVDGKSKGSSHGVQRKDASSGSDTKYINQPANKPNSEQERDKNVIKRGGYNAGLADFHSVLTTFTRYSQLRVIAELRHGDLSHSANIVSSIEFDRDDELFANAGVSRRIKVFDFSSVVNEPVDVHCPIADMSTRSKLCCFSWNKYAKNHIASSDYEGIVTAWDVNTHQSLMEYEENEKRAWSVDFSRTEPSMLVSGSDDCKVKVWCTKHEASVLNIDMKANICCVKYNPGSCNHIAVGSADHHIHYYDLRNISRPLHVFSGHRKAVSYVNFLSNNELASALTDSTLRLWDVKENLPVRSFRGHTNEKNFVGLTVNSEYIACGSETNEVFVYHKEIAKPVTWHRFGSPDVDDTEDDGGSYFISAVCWKSDSSTILTANSQGTIKVLVLAA